jgi:hypothetical protein
VSQLLFLVIVLVLTAGFTAAVRGQARDAEFSGQPCPGSDYCPKPGAIGAWS